MPRSSEIPALMDRIRAASKKNPERKWRRFPAKKGQTLRETVEARHPVPFEVTLAVDEGMAHFEIINRSGHTERVALVGTDPEVFIEIDGNRDHAASLPVGAESATVEIRRNDREGEVLVAVEIEEQGEPEDGPDSPDIELAPLPRPVRGN